MGKCMNHTCITSCLCNINCRPYLNNVIFFVIQSSCVRRPKFIVCTGGNPSGYIPTHSSQNSTSRYYVVFTLSSFHTKPYEQLWMSVNLIFYAAVDFSLEIYGQTCHHWCHKGKFLLRYLSCHIFWVPLVSYQIISFMFICVILFCCSTRYVEKKNTLKLCLTHWICSNTKVIRPST